MIQRKIKVCKCGCGKSGYIWARGMLKECYAKAKPKKAIQRVTPKKQERINESKIYYAKAIGNNIIQNKGKCICEECGDIIQNPAGRNVSHIISGGANGALYLDPLNNFILCSGCEQQWTSVDPSKMKIWAEAIRRREELNLKYYIGNKFLT